MRKISPPPGFDVRTVHPIKVAIATTLVCPTPTYVTYSFNLSLLNMKTAWVQLDLTLNISKQFIHKPTCILCELLINEMKNNWKSVYVFIHIEFSNWAGWYITHYSLLGQVLNSNWKNNFGSTCFVVVGNLFRAKIIWKRWYFCGQKNGSTGGICRFSSVI